MYVATLGQDPVKVSVWVGVRRCVCWGYTLENDCSLLAPACARLCVCVCVVCTRLFLPEDSPSCCARVLRRASCPSAQTADPREPRSGFLRAHPDGRVHVEPDARHVLHAADGRVPGGHRHEDVQELCAVSRGRGYT